MDIYWNINYPTAIIHLMYEIQINAYNYSHKFSSNTGENIVDGVQIFKKAY